MAKFVLLSACCHEETCCTEGPVFLSVLNTPGGCLNTWSENHLIGVLPKPRGAYSNDMEAMSLISALWFFFKCFLSKRRTESRIWAFQTFSLAQRKEDTAALLWVWVPHPCNWHLHRCQQPHGHPADVCQCVLCARAEWTRITTLMSLLPATSLSKLLSYVFLWSSDHIRNISILCRGSSLGPCIQ